VLVKLGSFWYPAWLIRRQDDGQWIVKFWRGCIFDDSITSADRPQKLQRVVVPVNKVKDELWRDIKGRQNTRVSSKTHQYSIVSWCI
jgi:hypothetical protein